MLAPQESFWSFLKIHTSSLLVYNKPIAFLKNRFFLQSKYMAIYSLFNEKRLSQNSSFFARTEIEFKNDYATLSQF